MPEIKKWYAVYTKPQWEKKVADLLIKANIETYCPLNRVMRQWSDRKKLIHEPLFTCYVFVHVETNEMRTVIDTNGVFNFVRWLNKPAIIRDEEIQLIRNFLDEHTNVKLEKADVSVNDIVRITNGAFMQSEGQIMSVSGSKVKIFLPTLGYVMVAETGTTNLELVRKASNQL